jgi:hypothetical protein
MGKMGLQREMDCFFRESHFIVRMKPNWLPVKEFLKSRKQDMAITMELPEGDFERYR